MNYVASLKILGQLQLILGSMTQLALSLSKSNLQRSVVPDLPDELRAELVRLMACAIVEAVKEAREQTDRVAEKPSDGRRE